MLNWQHVLFFKTTAVLMDLLDIFFRSFTKYLVLPGHKRWENMGKILI